MGFLTKTDAKEAINNLATKELIQLLVDIAEEREDEIFVMYHEDTNEFTTNRCIGCHCRTSGMRVMRDTVIEMGNSMYKTKS